MKIVSVSLFTDFSQFQAFYSQCEMGILLTDSLKGVRSFYNPPTGHLLDDAVLLLRQNPSGFYFLVKIRAFVI